MTDPKPETGPSSEGLSRVHSMYCSTTECVGYCPMRHEHEWKIGAWEYGKVGAITRAGSQRHEVVAVQLYCSACDASMRAERA